MIITNIKLYENMSFADYLALPGLSYSGTKGDGTPIVETEKMRFGSLVDCYLFEPAKYNGDKYTLVKPVAKAVHDILGPIIKHGKPQLVVTCTMIFGGLYVNYKGRIDLFSPVGGRIVFDLKCSEIKDLTQAINFFGYNHQLNGYALAAQAPVSMIISINPKTFHIQKQAIPTRCDWWENKVLQYGQPIAEGIKDVLSLRKNTHDEAGKILYI